MIDLFANLPLVEKVGWSVLGIILLGFVLVVCTAGLRRILGKCLEWEGIQTLEIKERVGLKLEFIKTAAQIIGGAFFILTIIVAYLNYKVSQEKHTTDLLTKAVEQLGSEKLEVRLGGIYALERIARDSEKDHWPLMEVLTAYVRENAPWPPKEVKQAKGLPDLGEKPDSFVKRLEAKLTYKIKPRADIQAILTVINRRERTFKKGEAMRLDLRHTDLRGADLWRGHLEGVYFVGTHLEGANLQRAHLENADLLLAHLEDADLWKAHLEEANLNLTHLEGSKLSHAFLKGTCLVGAHLEKAHLIGAHLEEAVLTEANLEGAILSSARLEGASFLYTKLEGASLNGAHLEGADLRGALNLTEDQIRQAIIDEKTILPDYLKHLEKSAGSKAKKE